MQVVAGSTGRRFKNNDDLIKNCSYESRMDDCMLPCEGRGESRLLAG